MKIIGNMKTYTKIGDMAQLESAITPKAKDTAMRAKYSKLSRYIVICPECFKSPKKSLEESVLLCGQQKTSNVSTHKNKYHKEVVLEESAVQSSQSQSNLSSMIVKNTSKSEATTEFRKLIYRFVNNCNLPALTVEKQPFRALLQFAINNAAALKDTPAEVMGRCEITKLRLSSYEDFFTVAPNLLNACRSEYQKLCRQKVPFITVCHDIWQAKDHDVLGVTLMFIDPRNCHIYRLPIGLAECDGHAATDVANLTDALLLGVGVTTADLCASVNDNTTAAVLAGKYIVGNPEKDGGKCDVHKAKLVLKHATGLVKRYHNRQLMDSNDTFVELWQVFKQFAAWLTCKKAPHRFKKFRDSCIQMGFTIIKIPMPNDTRIAGLVLTIQALLRCMWAMRHYVTLTIKSDDKFKARFPTEDKWELLAQYEAVLGPLKQICMSLQSDAPGASSAALLEIYCSYFRSTCMRKEEVGKFSGVDVLNVSDVNRTWDARSSMEDLEEFRDTKQYQELEPGPRLLIRRVIAEYKHYLLHYDDDSIKAVCCNPLLANVYENMFVHFGVFDQDTVKECRRIIIRDMVSKFSNKQVSRIGAAMSRQDKSQSNRGPKTGQGNDSAPTKSSSKRKTRDIFANMKESQYLQQQALLHLSGKASNAASEQELVQALQKNCTTCYDDFRSNCQTHIDNHWEQIIKEYGTAEFHDAKETWSDDEYEEFQHNCKCRNYLEVGKYFDIMGWWRAHSVKYGFLYPSAIIWLAKPSTNAFQERAFSIGSWMLQNKLMGNLSKKANEMRTMDYINRDTVRVIQKNEEDIKNGNGTSLSYVPPTKPPPEKTDKERVQQKNLKLLAIQEASTGFKTYSTTYKTAKNVLKDPEVVMTFFHTPDTDNPTAPSVHENTVTENSGTTARTTAGTTTASTGETKQEGKDEGYDESVTMGGTEKAVGENDGKPASKGNVVNGPVVKVANRLVHTEVLNRFSDDSDIESVVVSDTDEDSDTVVDYLIDEQIKKPASISNKDGKTNDSHVDSHAMRMGSNEESPEVEVVQPPRKKKKTVQATIKTTSSKKRKQEKQVMVRQPTRTSPPRKAKAAALARAKGSIKELLHSGTTPPSAKLIRNKQNKKLSVPAIAAMDDERENTDTLAGDNEDEQNGEAEDNNDEENNDEDNDSDGDDAEHTLEQEDDAGEHDPDDHHDADDAEETSERDDRVDGDADTEVGEDEGEDDAEYEDNEGNADDNDDDAHDYEDDDMDVD